MHSYTRTNNGIGGLIESISVKCAQIRLLLQPLKIPWRPRYRKYVRTKRDSTSASGSIDVFHSPSGHNVVSARLVRRNNPLYNALMKAETRRVVC